jgi:Domain of unknown function (DUF4301)
LQDKIAIQRKKLEDGNPIIHLSDSCRINHGIKRTTEEESKWLISYFNERKKEKDICFFIPASGSGSRMFSALHSVIENPTIKKSDFLADFISKVPKMALFQSVSDDWKRQFESGKVDELDFINYLLSKNGLNLGGLPKGLIPFHAYDDCVINPFQEHLLQGYSIGNDYSSFHFTIDDLFKEQITAQIQALEQRENKRYEYVFSVQDPLTNSIAFTENLEAATQADGLLITRPSGHGALIKNLDAINADIIFIRNIDNVQHQSKASHSLESRAELAGALLEFQEAVFNILKKVENGSAFASSVGAFNEKYDMRIPKDLYANEDFARNYFNRPLRVCGMVKNEGAPGGGPFWVNDNGNEVRQIIEKSQISDNEEQQKLMDSATHFNPVELVCAVKNYQGQKFELKEFINPAHYFIVHKTQEGKKIQYTEQAGLWNGAMAYWLTLFYEIDSKCFSPVKTVMDLLDEAHRG